MKEARGIDVDADGDTDDDGGNADEGEGDDGDDDEEGGGGVGRKEEGTRGTADSKRGPSTTGWLRPDKLETKCPGLNNQLAWRRTQPGG